MRNARLYELCESLVFELLSARRSSKLALSAALDIYIQVLVIAVLMKIILGRKFSVLQWEALVLLCVGVTINHLHHCGCAPCLLLLTSRSFP